MKPGKNHYSRIFPDTISPINNLIYSSIKFTGMHIILIKMSNHRTVFEGIKPIQNIHRTYTMKKLHNMTD